jgi:hypothetical protein
MKVDIFKRTTTFPKIFTLRFLKISFFQNFKKLWLEANLSDFQPKNNHNSTCSKLTDNKVKGDLAGHG